MNCKRIFKFNKKNGIFLIFLKRFFFNKDFILNFTSEIIWNIYLKIPKDKVRRLN